jgi:hypothetical protein
MKFAYADPPYLGMASLYRDRHEEAMSWNDPATHRQLIERLNDEFSDGWALSLHLPSLPLIWSFCPSARLCSWVKPFASFKKNVWLAYTWEPVLLRGGRKRDGLPTCRDHLSENIAMKKGLPGAKPLRFNQWVLGLLNWQPDDELVDLFPGTGGMQEALQLGVQDLGGPRAIRPPRSRNP